MESASVRVRKAMRGATFTPIVHKLEMCLVLEDLSKANDIGMVQLAQKLQLPPQVCLMNNVYYLLNCITICSLLFCSFRAFQDLS